MAHLDGCYFSISNTPGSASGFTVSAAVSGVWRVPPAGADGKTYELTIYETGVGREVCATVYTHSGTSFSRGALKTGSSRLTFTSAALVFATESADYFGRVDAAMQGITPGGRLTLTTGVPVTTSDVTAATSIYYTPYVSPIITLWDGSDWVPIAFTELGKALNYAGSLTSGKPHDVFALLNAGALDYDFLAWTNDTTRATAITLQDGRYCKSGDKTRLYLGTFYTTSTTTTEDSEAKRLLYNAYNQAARSSKSPAGVSHQYSSSTLRRWNAGSGTQPEAAFVVGLPASLNFAGQWFCTNVSTNAVVNATCRLYLDATTDIQGADSQMYGGPYVNGFGSTIPLQAGSAVAAGYHFVTIFEAEYSGNNIDYQKAITQVLGLRS